MAKKQSKTGGGPGTNQWKVQGASSATPKPPSSGESQVLQSMLAPETSVLTVVSLSPEVYAEARQRLVDAGVTTEQMETVVGGGLRNTPGCLPEDTVLNKVASGALSVHGVMAHLYGHDSPQHHAGRADVSAPVDGFKDRSIGAKRFVEDLARVEVQDLTVGDVMFVPVKSVSFQVGAEVGSRPTLQNGAMDSVSGNHFLVEELPSESNYMTITLRRGTDGEQLTYPARVMESRPILRFDTPPEV